MSAFNNTTRQAIYAARRSSGRARAICGSYAAFERAKQWWRQEHPDASPREYELAMLELARTMGV